MLLRLANNLPKFLINSFFIVCYFSVMFYLFYEYLMVYDFSFKDELSLTDVVVWGTLYPLLAQDSHQTGFA